VRRAGHPRLAWATLAIGLAGSALVGVSRVASGAHFPTDVLAGYAVGAGAGIAIPALHDLELEATPLALPGARGLAIAGRF
jgi:membrane-associated phospholipid phosphatase